MLKITKQNNSIVVEGVDNKKYPDNAVLSFPLNSIICEVDESEIVTFHSAANYDVLFSGNVNDITVNGEAVTKENIGVKFGAISNVSGGGGGGGLTPEQEQRLNNAVQSADYNADKEAQSKVDEAQNAAIEEKQDKIEDIDAIREGAEKGATAIQEETDPIWNAEKHDYYKTVEVDVLIGEAKASANAAISIASSAEGIASAAHSRADEALEKLEKKADKSEIPSLDGYATEEWVESKGYLTEFTETDPTVPQHVKNITQEDINKWNSGVGEESDPVWEAEKVNYYTKDEVNTEIAKKQDKIDDIEEIRSGAALGATALQSFTEQDPTVPAHVKGITEEQIAKWDEGNDVIGENQAPKDNIGIGVFNVEGGSEVKTGELVKTGDVFYMRPLAFGEMAQINLGSKGTIWFRYQDEGSTDYSQFIGSGWTIYNKDMEPVSSIAVGSDGYARWSDVDSEILIGAIFTRMSGLPEKGVYVYDGTDTPSKVVTEKSLDGYATEQWVEGKGYLTEHQPLKTINGESVIGSGNIEIKSGDEHFKYNPTEEFTNGLMVEDSNEDTWELLVLRQLYSSSAKMKVTINTTATNNVSFNVGGDIFTIQKTSMGTYARFISNDADANVKIYRDGELFVTADKDNTENELVLEDFPHYEFVFSADYQCTANKQGWFIYVSSKGSNAYIVKDGKKDKLISENSLNEKHYISEETDPTVPSWVKQITFDEILRWDRAITEEVDPIWIADKPNYYLKSEIDSKIADIELFKFPNVTIFGTPQINHGQMGNFSINNYAQFPFLVDFHSQPFEIDMCFTTGVNVTAQENIFDSDHGLAFAVRNGKFVIAMSSDGQSWNMGEHVGWIDVNPLTTYYVKLYWVDGTYKLDVSTDKESYTTDIEFNDDRTLYPKQIVIGKGGSGENHFSGIINLNYCYLSIRGQKVWQGMDDAGLATRLSTDLENIDQRGVEKVNEIVTLKTINGESIKGDGNIEIQGGGGDNWHIALNGNDTFAISHNGEWQTRANVMVHYYNTDSDEGHSDIPTKSSDYYWRLDWGSDYCYARIIVSDNGANIANITATNPLALQKKLSDEQIGKWNNVADIVKDGEAPKDNLGIAIMATGESGEEELHVGDTIHSGDMFHYTAIGLMERYSNVGNISSAGNTTYMSIQYFDDEGSMTWYSNNKANWKVFNSQMEDISDNIRTLGVDEECYIQYVGSGDFVIGEVAYMTRLTAGEKHVVLYDGTETPSRIATKDEIPNLDNYYTKDEVDALIGDINNALAKLING